MPPRNHASRFEGNQKSNCKHLRLQTAKACNLKHRFDWKIDSRSMAWGIFHGRLGKDDGLADQFGLRRTVLIQDI
jgi:hypothetical protein